MHIYSYQSFKSHPFFTTCEIVDGSKASRLREGAHYVILDAARHYSRPTASLYCILYVTLLETGRRVSISVSGRPEEAACLGVIRDWPEGTLVHVDVGVTKNGYPRLTSITPIHPATPPRVGKSPVVQGNSLGAQTAALVADFCFRRAPGQPLCIPCLLQRGRPDHPVVMVVAARPCSQFWEDSLPTLLNGAPNLRWAYVELLTDLAAFNACAAQIPMWKHDYREFETAMAGHDINTDFGKPDEPLPALTLGEWACLEKVDSDSGRFAGVFGWLFFESHR